MFSFISQIVYWFTMSENITVTGEQVLYFKMGQLELTLDSPISMNGVYFRNMVTNEPRIAYDFEEKEWIGDGRFSQLVRCERLGFLELARFAIDHCKNLNGFQGCITFLKGLLENDLEVV